MTTGTIQAQEGNEFSLLALTTLLLRRRRLLVALPLSLAFVVGLVGLIAPRTFVSVASFTPQSTAASGGRLAGLAAQFGVPLGGAGAGFTAEFYVGLLNSPELVNKIVDAKYSVRKRGSWLARDTALTEGTLVDILEIDEGSPAASRARAALLLEDLVSVSLGRVSGIVQVRASSTAPDLAYALAVQYLREVDEFNQRQRRDVAAAERVFVEARLREAEEALRSAETSTERFLSANRSIQSSPQLQFEFERLKRAASMAQTIVSTLQQSLEQARIEELRNTPVVTVVSAPELPAIPARRYLVLKVAAALLVGLLLAVVAAIGLEVLGADAATDASVASAFASEWAATLDDVRHPWRLVPWRKRLDDLGR